MLDLMPRMPAEGARWPVGLGRAAILGTSAIFFAAASVAPAAAEEVDELKSEMRQLLDRIDQLEQNQQRTQIEVDQIESNSAWLVNERAVRARASIINPVVSQGDYVSGGDFPGSFKLPGSDSSMAFYGFMKADYHYNFGPLRIFGPSLAVPAFQPLRGSAGATNTGQTNFRFNASQFNVETRTPSEYGEIRTLLQFDWFETDFDGTNINSTVNEIRSGLRLAQASIGPWTFGQQWTVFTDLSQYAETADWENINSGPICRCPSLTYADSLGGGWSFGVSIVDPVTQIDLDMGNSSLTTGTVAPGAASSGILIRNNTGMPDLQANIKYAQDWGHVFLSGQVRRVSYTADDAVAGGVTGANLRNATGKAEDSLTGWGFTAALNLYDPLGLHPRDRFYTNVTYGEGMRGIIDHSLFCNTCTLEASLNPFTGELDANSNFAFTIHYQHWWTDTIRSSIIYGLTRNSPGNDFDSVGTIRRTQAGFLNIFWSPLPRVNLGLETHYLETKMKGFGTLDGNDTIQIQATAMILW